MLFSRLVLVELSPQYKDLSRSATRPPFSKMLVAPDIPADPPPTTIAWSEKDRLRNVHQTSAHILADNLSRGNLITDQVEWTPLQDHYDKNGKGRRTGVEQPLEQRCFSQQTCEPKLQSDEGHEEP